MTDKELMRHLKRDAKKRRPGSEYSTVLDIAIIATLLVVAVALAMAVMVLT